MITFSLKKFRISLTFGFFFVLAITTLRDNSLGAMSLVFCIAHEFGHLIAIKLLGITVSEIKFYGAGISISSDGISAAPRRNQAFVYLAGPAVNLLLSAILTGDLRSLNLCLAVFNLIPICYFDGGRLISLFLPKEGMAVRLLSVLSYALLAVLFIIAALTHSASVSGSSVMTLIFIALSCFLD